MRGDPRPCMSAASRSPMSASRTKAMRRRVKKTHTHTHTLGKYRAEAVATICLHCREATGHWSGDGAISFRRCEAMCTA